MSSTPVKKFQRAMARGGLLGCSWLFDRLPYCVVVGITQLLLMIGYVFIIKQKRVAKESLAIAFGKEKSPKEINQITRQCFKNMGRGMTELLYYLSHPALAKEKVTFEGKEKLDQALKERHGVIAVTAHFGNFPLMMLRLALEGYKVNSIIRPTRDPKVEEFLLKKRNSCGMKTIYAIPRKESVIQSLKVLRENEVLFIPLDQNFGNGKGVFVDFFGQKAATATGPVVFSLRTQAVILPIFIVQQGKDEHKIIIEPPVELEMRADENEMIAVNIAKITKIIEKYIRQYPAEWGWMHRRWKTQPPEEVLQNSSVVDEGDL